jgi:hypothetical protein
VENQFALYKKLAKLYFKFSGAKESYNENPVIYDMKNNLCNTEN